MKCLTSKIGFAPMKNLTASVYASDLMHFPSLVGRSYINCIVNDILKQTEYRK